MGIQYFLYYALNELLISTLTYLSNKNNNDNNGLFSYMKGFFCSEKKKLFDENCLQQIG